ncbi:hypothetical protein SAMN04487762_2818 [Polaribacter sp. Hel1_33_78]|uniref:DUF6427 family protein n=1 Tax=Polaribacter sp. Hel1_33_78 TaxID=1336804 RepID=UPI00087CC66E|nr:DUF6427 family protein [Polaribacter sp. Hel1_33_78]SDU27083.1 hypothetical protein SAMN04487762_2818 [Polaribacter sp. Hel1_33_78]
MLANFLNKTKPINFIGLLIFFFLCFSFSVFFTIFYDGFTLDKLLKSGILLLLFLGVFFFYNFILSKNKLTFDNSYAYFIFTLLTVCILPELINYKSLLLTIIYFLFLRKTYSLRSSKKVIQKLFDSGLWLGVLFIFEPFSILFLILIFTGTYLHQKITIHTILTPIIAFITPIFLYFTYFFWVDKTQEFNELFSFKSNFDFQVYEAPKYYWFIISIFIFSLFSVIFKSIATIAISNTFRRSWYLLIINLLTVILFLILLPVKNGSELLYVLFPVSVVIANGIELIDKKKMKDLVLYIFLVGCIFLSFFL